jgi:hypothetical protein
MTISYEQEEQELRPSQITKKCTLCKAKDDGGLIRLPEEFQRFSRRKKFVSWFCPSCLQVVNFLL